MKNAADAVNPGFVLLALSDSLDILRDIGKVDGESEVENKISQLGQVLQIVTSPSYAAYIAKLPVVEVMIVCASLHSAIRGQDDTSPHQDDLSKLLEATMNVRAQIGRAHV